MSVGISMAQANIMLDTISSAYLQLHIGDPGADGTSNIATVSDRTQITLQPALDGVRITDGAVEWGSTWPATPQRVSHVTIWSAASGGSFIYSSALVSQIDFVENMNIRILSVSIAIPSIASD